MEATAITEPPRNQIGQTMGNKGMRTRRKLIDATTALLNEKGLRDLRVADVARAAGMSTASFYVYFETVQDVVLAAAAELSQSTDEILDLLDLDWNASNALDYARRFVHSYVDFWQEHRAIFRVRNLASEEDDVRFTKIRMDSVRSLILKLSDLIERNRGDQTATAKPHAMAGALIAMIERVSAVHNSYASQSGISRDDLTEATATIFASSIVPANR